MPAITKLRTFVDNLADITVAGVNRKYKSPPRQVTLADLPASWVRSPEISDDALTTQTHGGWPTLRAEYVIAVEATELNQPGENFLDTVDLLDNLNTALRALTVGTSLGKAKITWTARQDWVPVGATTYWAVVAEVEAHG